jgi:hypothetical protein
MEKIHISQTGAALSFMKKLDCAESTYLTIPGKNELKGIVS